MNFTSTLMQSKTTRRTIHCKLTFAFMQSKTCELKYICVTLCWTEQVTLRATDKGSRTLRYKLDFYFYVTQDPQDQCFSLKTCLHTIQGLQEGSFNICLTSYNSRPMRRTLPHKFYFYFHAIQDLQEGLFMINWLLLSCNPRPVSLIIFMELVAKLRIIIYF